MKVSAAEIKEIQEWYDNLQNVVSMIKLNEKYEFGDEDYELGAIHAIEDMAKKLGIYNELMGIKKMSEDEKEFYENEAEDDYKREQAMEKAYGGWYEIHD